MLEYTIELEKKIENYEITDKTRFVMTFFGDGFDWHLSQLEDFADFYKTGRHNWDDSFRIMEDHFINEKNIKFQKNINGFCYAKRPKTHTEILEFICSVRGPWIGNRWTRVDR